MSKPQYLTLFNRKDNITCAFYPYSVDRWMPYSVDRWMPHSVDRWMPHSVDRWMPYSVDIRIPCSYYIKIPYSYYITIPCSYYITIPCSYCIKQGKHGIWLQKDLWKKYNDKETIINKKMQKKKIKKINE